MFILFDMVAACPNALTAWPATCRRKKHMWHNNNWRKNLQFSTLWTFMKGFSYHKCPFQVAIVAFGLFSGGATGRSGADSELSQADLTGGMCFLLYTGGDEEKLSCIAR